MIENEDRLQEEQIEQSRQKYVLEFEKIIGTMNEEALPHIMKMIAQFALQHQNKPRLTLVVGGRLY